MERFFKCSLCQTINSSEAWNKSTSEIFNDDIVEIENIEKGYVWICPSCKKDVEFGEISEVSNEINLQKYVNYLRIILDKNNIEYKTQHKFISEL